MDLVERLTWVDSWVVALPLVLVTVTTHVAGLTAIASVLGHILRRRPGGRRSGPMFPILAGLATVAVRVLHGLEAGVWSLAYYLIGALPTLKQSTLYSLEAITGYGHSAVTLAPRWQLMGGVEALAGLLQMGLTTAFLYQMIQQVRPFHGLHEIGPAARPPPH